MNPIQQKIIDLERKEKEIEQQHSAAKRSVAEQATKLNGIMRELGVMCTQWSNLGEDIAAALVGKRDFGILVAELRERELDIMESRVPNDLLMLYNNGPHLVHAPAALSVCEKFLTQRTQERSELEKRMRAYAAEHQLEDSLPPKFPAAA